MTLRRSAWILLLAPCVALAAPVDDYAWQWSLSLPDAEPNVIFAGRLGSYRYYNMDQVVAQALALHRRMMAVPVHA